jgi:hypothetical protein
LYGLDRRPVHTVIKRLPAPAHFPRGLPLEGITVTETAAELDTPGIRHPDDSGRWLVPPWPADVTVCQLVQHFTRFEPALHACSAIQAAYYGRYAAVLAATPTTDLLSQFSWQWYEGLLSAVNRSATSAEAEHLATLDAAQRTMQLTLVRALGLNTHPIDGHAR